ncbi:MAG: hypothetical protein MJ188_11400 [Treponema sp.]|nr:hypothetical protein [Treponema sp.]
MNTEKTALTAKNVDDFVEYLWLNRHQYKSIIQESVEIKLLAFKSAGLKINPFDDNLQTIDTINKEIAQRETALLATINQTFEINFDIQTNFFNNFIATMTNKALM